MVIIGGTTIYLFSAVSIGIFLGTIARTMAQFALLLMIVIIPMMLLSGGITPIESQPAIVQPFTWIFPSRHFMAFSQSVVFRGADFSIVWPELLNIITLGMVFFVSSLALFRPSIAVNK
ncbi:ABC transporter permease [Shewanella inventionis]|uniref:ABC transporter permease n=1 Tax=Shewanella inventionis TaxID=1738770 RepID=UPI001E357701|nr:ABC transporter permease [Shewanella inventionis]MCL1159414.1 ABC transporter permease [Shewanella inventionis]